jgi:hypothetical protein
VTEKLEKIIAIILQEIRAIKELLSQKPPLKKALEEFIRVFCLIPVHVLFWNISASKRNKSCIALNCLIPDYLPYSGTDLLKIRPIIK